MFLRASSHAHSYTTEGELAKACVASMSAKASRRTKFVGSREKPRLVHPEMVEVRAIDSGQSMFGSTAENR
jgi:hypothetical protein